MSCEAGGRQMSLRCQSAAMNLWAEVLQGCSVGLSPVQRPESVNCWRVVYASLINLNGCLITCPGKAVHVQA